MIDKFKYYFSSLCEEKKLSLFYFSVIVFLCYGTGLVSDDFNDVRDAELGWDLLIPKGNKLNVPLLHYTHHIAYLLSSVENYWLIMYYSDGTETRVPANGTDKYLKSQDIGNAANIGALWELEDGALSCNAKRNAVSTAAGKVYVPCTGIAGAEFAGVEDPQTRVATDGVAAGTQDYHTSGGKANVLAGDGHVEATTAGVAQNASAL